MAYIFHPQLAKDYGIDETIMIGALLGTEFQHFFTHGVEIDNKLWIKIDRDISDIDFKKEIPFWSFDKCEQLIRSLADKKIIEIKQHKTSDTVCFIAFSDMFIFSQIAKELISVYQSLIKK
jgi:hypothetical protein